MSKKHIVIRAKHTAGITSVRALIQHPMIRARSTLTDMGKTDKPNFIQEVTCTLGEQIILSALWGNDIGKNPFLAFTFKGGAKGETIKLSWVDNQGEHDSVETLIG